MDVVSIFLEVKGDDIGDVAGVEGARGEGERKRIGGDGVSPLQEPADFSFWWDQLDHRF